MYQAVIFDLDGTIIDSEGVWFNVFTELCARYGKTYTAYIHGKQLGLSGLACAKQICDALDLPLTPEAFYEERLPIQNRLFSQTLPAMPGAVEFVRALHSAGHVLGLATASSKEFRERMLQGIGILECFDVCVSGNEVDNPKPAPDIYLKVAELLAVDPRECLAVEDGRAGVQSALSAGMDVLGVVDRRFNSDLPGVTQQTDSLVGLGVKDVAVMYGR